MPSFLHHFVLASRVTTTLVHVPNLVLNATTCTFSFIKHVPVNLVPRDLSLASDRSTAHQSAVDRNELELVSVKTGFCQNWFLLLIAITIA